MINVRTNGAKGNGCADDTMAIQSALDAKEHDVLIPDGLYRITATLKVPSHKHIHASQKARLVLMPERPLLRGEFLLCNADPFRGNEDITIDGGIWDGGYGGKYNVKDPDLFAPEANSGACMNFIHVEKLRLLNLVVANTIVYHIRMSMLRDFEIRNIGFTSEKTAYNQDGLHFGGEVYNGVVENIRALTVGQTNDDMIALNADDSTQRSENRGLVCGPIENIVFRNIYADDCYSAIRLSSISAPIRHITFENVYAGCRCYAINMDALRYCRTPLLLEDAAPDGVGCIEDISINGMRVFYTDSAMATESLICAEEHADRFRITGFSRLMEKDACPERPTLIVRNVPGETVAVDGKTPVWLTDKKQSVVVRDFSELSMAYRG